MLAWVLWSHFTFSDGEHAAQDRWDRIAAAASRQECVEALSRASSANMRLVESAPTFRVYAPRTLKPGHASSMRFTCLPATTDPRDGLRQ